MHRLYKPGTAPEGYNFAEMCPHCGEYIPVEVDNFDYNYEEVCPVCGKKLMLCTLCYWDQELEEDFGGSYKCDWSEQKGCYRDLKNRKDGAILCKREGEEMANKKVEERKRNKTQAAYAYEQNYIKENIKFVSVPFNLKHEDERGLYIWLKSKKESGEIKSIGGFIKNFLLDEMNKDN